MNKSNLLYVIAAAMLAGLGIYYFLFERATMWWVYLLAASLFNTYLAWKVKEDNSK